MKGTGREQFGTEHAAVALLADARRTVPVVVRPERGVPPRRSGPFARVGPDTGASRDSLGNRIVLVIVAIAQLAEAEDQMYDQPNQKTISCPRYVAL